MNVDAVKLPAGCIDYLLVHELCHLRVPHHGAGVLAVPRVLHAGLGTVAEAAGRGRGLIERIRLWWRSRPCGGGSVR
jgi:hypothetical protein